MSGYGDGYYNMKYYTGDRNRQLEDEVRQSLFKLPNEQEIEDEMREVERLKKLDEEYKQKRQELEKQRTKINVTKLDKIDSEQKRLAQRLEYLVNEPKENDQEEIYKLIALKRKIAESEKSEMKVLQDQYLLKKEKEIEDKVRKMIELERICEDKKKLNEKFSKIKMEVDMIQAEEESRVMNTKKYLDRALERNISNNLNNDAFKKGLERSGMQGRNNDYMSEQDKILLSKVLLDENVAGQKDKELILKEIQQGREQEKRKVQLELQEKQRQLNDQRFELMEEGEKLVKRKVQHYELQKKGVEFLASIEQGQAPPMEFILQNLQNVDDDQYRSQMTTDDVISRAKKFSKIGRSRIEFLKSEHKEYFGYDPYDKPYNGELKPLIQRMNPENVYISRLIIDWLLELVMRKHYENQNELAATREKQNYLQDKAKRIQKKIDTMTNSQSYVEIRDRIFNKVIDKIIREAAFEIATVNQMAKTISLNLIVRAIKGERNSGNSEEQLSKIFYSLRNADMTKKNDPNFRFNYKDMAKIEDTGKKKKDKKDKAKDDKQKQKDKEKEKEKQKEEEEEQEEDDQTVLQLYPEQECIDILGSEDILKMESDYWSHMFFKEQPFLQHNPKKKIIVTAINLSFNKELLAVGYSNGTVQIFTTPPADVMLLASVEEVMPKRIVNLDFAFDNMSQLIVIDEDGNLTVNFNAYNLRANVDSSKQQQTSDAPLVMRPYYSFNWKILTRSGRGNNPEALKLVYAGFHPGITFTVKFFFEQIKSYNLDLNNIQNCIIKIQIGLQPYIMLGCEKGLIMKFNSNKDLYNATTYKFPIHNVVNSPIITFNQAEFPNEHNKILEIVDNHNETSSKPVNIFREFFVEHKARIIQIVFLNKPETFLTIDSKVNYIVRQINKNNNSLFIKKGYIFYWVYEKDQYLVKIDGYFPKSKYKVSCQVMTYVPKPGESSEEGPNIVKVDLNKGGKSKDEGGKMYFKQIISENETYDKDLVFLKYNQSESLKHIADVVVTKEQFPTEPGEDVIFYRGRVNFKDQKFENLSEERYMSQLVEGQVSKCQAISGNKYVVIQQILPHKIDFERVYIQFVRFDTNLFRLKKVKIQLESPDVDDIDFSVVEDFGPFGTPYIFILMRQGLYVASLATGSILYDFKNHLQIIQQEVKLNQDVVANHIKHVLDMYFIISSTDSNGAYIFNIEDGNDDSDRKAILSNQIEYKRLYAV